MNLLDNFVSKQDKERDDFLKKTVGNFGKIVEEDDKITVFVTKNGVKKSTQPDFHQIMCHGVNTDHEETKKEAEKFNLIKPVYYIFDGITFGKKVWLFAHRCNVIFRNCTFEGGLRISESDIITLENNTYISTNHSGAFVCGSCKELTIKDDNIVNSSEKSANNTFGIDLETSKINIINSHICAENLGEVNLSAEDILLNDSIIIGPKSIKISSDKIISDFSTLRSSDSVTINNKNNDFYGKVVSPKIVYNGKNLKTSNITIVQGENYDLEKTSTDLLQSLRDLRDYYSKIKTKKSKRI